MTRAVHALCLYLPGPRQRNQSDTWHNLLLATLAPENQMAENSLVYEQGDARWYENAKVEAAPDAVALRERPQHIRFASKPGQRRRGLEHVAPSRFEGKGCITLGRLFNPTDGTGTAAGTLYHAWLALVGWFEDGLPTEQALRSRAETMRADLPLETWNDLESLLANFRRWLANPAINAVLRRSAYADPKSSGFPAALASSWTKAMHPLRVEMDRRFLVRDGARFWNGSFDRIVWLAEGDRIVAADVMDFKTDALAPGDEAALAARVEHYWPQVEAYRQAVVCLAGLRAERVAARLIFTIPGRVVEV
jgi:hypothetical protein